jgi:hypothetical protein
MRLRKRALAVISAGLFLVAGLHPAEAVAVGDSTGPWEIGIYEFPNCLEVQGGSTANSAQVQLWSCDGSKSHRTWYMEEVASGWWRIKNTKSGKCLNVQGASKDPGAKVIQYTCQSVSKYNDQWQLLYSGVSGNNGDLYTLHNRKSKLCLNAERASTANGTDLIQDECTGAWYDFFTWWPAR